MGVLVKLRRRWRTILWVALGLAVFIIFIDVSHPRLGGSQTAGKVVADTPHLQAIRKRLNKSNPNSSSLNYVDWDPKDVAHDLEAAKTEHRKHVVGEPNKEGVRGAARDANDNDDNESNNNYNLENFALDNFKGQDDNINKMMIAHKNSAANRPSSTTLNGGRGRSKGEGYGARMNYSVPEAEDFVEKFQVKYKSSKYSVNAQERYLELAKRFNAARRKGSKLPAYVQHSGGTPWELFHSGIRQYQLYDPENPAIDSMLHDFATKEIISVEQKEGGTQIKLILTLEDEGQALCKPMRYGREQETLPDHFYFSDYERHTAEIAAFHLDKALGFHRVPPTLGRLMNISWDIQRVSSRKLAKTFFISPAGNWCFHGSCSYYCDSSHPICGHPMMLEGSLAAFLPPSQTAARKTWRNPWKRSYSKHKKAYWELYDDLCEQVKQKPPFNKGRRLLDVLDMSVFDFLTGNLDRHHYETFQDFGNDTFLLHLDNGRAFGKSHYDCLSCLAPVRQCCMIRLSTLTKLVKLYIGPDSLSQVMRSSLTLDPLNPILLEPHLDALDRRVTKILQVINKCLLSGLSWNEVIIDDGVT